MRSMVEGVCRPHRLCPNALSVGFAATSPLKYGEDENDLAHYDTRDITHAAARALVTWYCKTGDVDRLAVALRG